MNVLGSVNTPKEAIQAKFLGCRRDRFMPNRIDVYGSHSGPYRSGNDPFSKQMGTKESARQASSYAEKRLF